MGSWCGSILDMATQIVGNAAFRYDTTGEPGEVEVRLGTRLHDITPSRQQTRFVTHSVDQTARDVVTIGGALDQVVATIRFHDDSQELTRLISDNLGSSGTLKYIPDLAVPGTQYHVRLMSAGDVSPDTEMAARGHYSARITIKQFSSTANSLEPLTWLHRLLFSFTPGKSLADGTFTRSSTGAQGSYIAVQSI